MVFHILICFTEFNYGRFCCICSHKKNIHFTENFIKQIWSLRPSQSRKTYIQITIFFIVHHYMLIKIIFYATSKEESTPQTKHKATKWQHIKNFTKKFSSKVLLLWAQYYTTHFLFVYIKWPILTYRTRRFNVAYLKIGRASCRERV